MNISEAQYVNSKVTEKKNSIIRIVEDSVTRFVPVSEENRYYVEILKQVKEGTLTIKDAE